MLHLRYLFDSLKEISNKNLNATEIYYDALAGSYAESNSLENDETLLSLNSINLHFNYSKCIAFCTPPTPTHDIRESFHLVGCETTFVNLVKDLPHTLSIDL